MQNVIANLGQFFSTAQVIPAASEFECADPRIGLRTATHPARARSSKPSSQSTFTSDLALLNPNLLLFVILVYSADTSSKNGRSLEEAAQIGAGPAGSR